MPVEIQKVETVKCPHCGSEAVVKYGSHKGIPRYWCKVCQRKFRWVDKQFKMRLPTEQIATALHDYYDGGSSVRAIGRHVLAETGSIPSTATIYEWIQKYTQYLTDSIKDYHPNVGSIWIADETAVKIAGQNVWLWDLIDRDTRYLLSSRLSTSRTAKDAQILIDRAIKTAGKNPQVVLTDKLASYLDVSYGKETEHRQGSPFSLKETGESTSHIERWHGTVKARTKVMRGLKNLESAHDFVAGFLAFYNYLRPHESLDNKTPAEVADVAYPYGNWSELISKYKPSKKITVEHVKRGEEIKIQGFKAGRQPIRLSQPTPRLTPKTPRISHKPPSLGKNELYVGRNMVSRHPFKGAKRRRMA